MITKELGRICAISVGMGGYDDAMFGVSISLGTDGWGIEDFRGTWSMDPSKTASWTKEDQIKCWGEMCKWVSSLLKEAKKNKVSELVNVPVEISMDNGRLVSWRILKEVI